MNRLWAFAPRHTMILVLLILGLSAPTRVTAHDSWLVAGKNVAAKDEPVRLTFVTAEVFPISEQAAKPQRVAEWVVFQGGQQRKVEGYAVALVSPWTSTPTPPSTCSTSPRLPRR